MYACCFAGDDKNVCPDISDFFWIGKYQKSIPEYLCQFGKTPQAMSKGHGIYIKTILKVKGWRFPEACTSSRSESNSQSKTIGI
jgi:hypothetical protein